MKKVQRRKIKKSLTSRRMITRKKGSQEEKDKETIGMKESIIQTPRTSMKIQSSPSCLKRTKSLNSLSKLNTKTDKQKSSRRSKPLKRREQRF